MKHSKCSLRVLELRTLLPQGVSPFEFTSPDSVISKGARACIASGIVANFLRTLLESYKEKCQRKICIDNIMIISLLCFCIDIFISIPLLMSINISCSKFVYNLQHFWTLPCRQQTPSIIELNLRSHYFLERLTTFYYGPKPV